MVQLLIIMFGLSVSSGKKHLLCSFMIQKHHDVFFCESYFIHAIKTSTFMQLKFIIILF